MLKRLALWIYRPLKQELENLRELNNDLAHQVTELHAARPMTDDQWKDVEKTRVSHDMLVREHGKVVVAMQQRFPQDFPKEGGGVNEGRTFSEIAIKYMRER